MDRGMTMAEVRLDDKYALERGRVLLTGTQALVRLLLLQAARDRAAGLSTAGYVSGYRGSPLGGLDQQLVAARQWLEAARVRFAPGVNEDLAATAIWGTQQVGLLPGARTDGVFALWYGKGPGVDRSGDPFKHGNRAGTAPHGGVLLACGDDHAGKSSTVAYQSEPALAANGIPVLYPASVQEILDLGVHGYALSRFAGVWVGFKTVNETVESTATVDVDPERVSVRLPELPESPGGVHIRFGFDPLSDDVRLQRFKLPRVQAYARRNRLDRVSHAAPRRAGLGIVSAGKAWTDVCAALDLLGLDAEALAHHGVSVYKVAMVWPLEPEGLVEFARGQAEILVVEEKSAFLEPQVARILYNLLADERPALSGKHAPDGAELQTADTPTDPVALARLIAARLVARGLAEDALCQRVAGGEDRSAPGAATGVARTPYFCSGCPHNTSTRVPDGSVAFGGIGCHTMALFMERATLPPTQMGGEGLNWVGMAPFTSRAHAFQNIGDGTYFHSGVLAIRAAVAAGTNVTYKLLYNDAVAMTGGQAVEGGLSVGEITHQLRAERVGRIVVVTDDEQKYDATDGLAAGVTVRSRRDLDAVQRELRDVPGVTALIYDQTCAAEKRRRRKRGQYPNPDRRMLINPLVCEGCGDCSKVANCVSIEPLETPFGRKRRIDQSSCNKDYSCADGFCPSFVSIEGARLRKPRRGAVDPARLAALPEPPTVELDGPVRILVTGIGGTGVVTIGAVLAMAAHLEEREASTFDMTGLAQKGGAVYSHLQIAPRGASLSTARIVPRGADVVIGCDLVVTASAETMATVAADRTRVVLNTHLVPTGQFQLRPDLELGGDALLARIEATVGSESVRRIDATAAARMLAGDSVGANLLMVGFACQSGWLPIGYAAIERAIRLNGTAVEANLLAFAIGRLAAADPSGFAELLAAAQPESVTPTPADMETRAKFLAQYQNAAWAERYRKAVTRIEQAESRGFPGNTRLTAAVTANLFKLMSVKDEYEVARLQTSPEFDALIAHEFEGPVRRRYHLAPPLFARRDPVTGVPRKRAFGAWLTPVLRLLARLRPLRGTPVDPFAYTRDRRLDRRLLADYETLIEEWISSLDESNYAIAVELAELPSQIRGFGHVREKSATAADTRRAELLQQWRARR
jgi:indolepyruvate ferredoxin oxidoreductase